MFDYTGKKIVTIDSCKKEILNEFARIRKLTSLSSPWPEKIKPEKVWLYESIDKLKRVGNQGKVKMNEIKIHTIADLQRHVQSYGLPKLPIFCLGRIYEHIPVALPLETNNFHQRPLESKKSLFLEIWRDMGREVKVFILHVGILLYH